jgi:hypothetical protein
MRSLKATVLIFIFLALSLQGHAQGLAANNDEVYIGPLETARVDVVLNDVRTCNNYILRIISYDSSKGTATIDGDFIIFKPAPSVREETVTIQYGLACNHMEKTATLSVHISKYIRPGNVIPPNVECWEAFPTNVGFDVKNKFNTNEVTPKHSKSLLVHSIPLVGDLNGDRKPEILAIGLYATSSRTRASARYITIIDGQTGKTLIEYDTQCEFAVSSDLPDASAYHSSPSYMAIADVDNDGKGEIIMTFPVARNDAINQYGERVVAFKVVTNNANKIINLRRYWKAPIGYKTPLTGTNHRVYDVPTPYIADLNGDGIPEVIVYNKIYNAQTGRLLMAWDGPASTPKRSSLSLGSGLYEYQNSAIYTKENISDNVYNRAFVGRRPSTATEVWKDDYIAVFAVENMDSDDDLEVIAGNRIYKFQFNYLGKDGEGGSHENNTYTTIEGPRSVTLPTTGSNTVTYYLSDGFTRVADIDGDGHLDVINISEVATSGGWGSRVTGLITVWDPRYPSTIKAASAFHSKGGDEAHIPTFGIPFIGDINGKVDGGWNGSQFTKKLPEIGFLTGTLHINSSNSNPKRNGITFHPLSDENLRRDVGWDNNNTSAWNRRFNRSSISGGQGHIFAVTYCDSAGIVPYHRRLKLSWAMEHDDRSADTGLTIFDFNNDGAKDLVYRDEKTLRVISPKYSGKDYVAINEEGTEWNTSVMFRTDAYSLTGYEAAIVADVNMDASADIVVTQSHKSNFTDGRISVFEYKSGTSKWAPAPPVWHQAYYNPTQVRENLTIPARPPAITSTYTLNGETITPYNGAWIQQPVVKEGEDYAPVIRLPDAVLTKIVVVGSNPTQVTLTILNRGTASINANTPIAFRNGGTAGLSFDASTLIRTYQVGVDIFPNEKVTRTYSLPGNYSNTLIWARIMDNGGATFPATGYRDCRIDDLSNRIAGSDCVPEYVIVATPDTVLCGHTGGSPVTLTVSSTGTISGNTVTYQWYRNEMLLENDTLPSCAVLLPGDYTCFVTDGVCWGYTPVKTLTLHYMEAEDDYVDGVFGGVPRRVNVLENDVVPPTCTPAVSVTVPPKLGTYTVTDNQIEYTLNSGLTAGEDTLVYRIAEGVTAQVYITITEAFEHVADTGCRIPLVPSGQGMVEGWSSRYDAVESSRPWYVGDLDGDGKPEIVALSLDGKHTAGDNRDLFTKIVVFPGQDRDQPVEISTVAFGGYYAISAYGIVKVYGEGLIVVVGADGYLHAYSYATRTKKWTSNQPALWNPDIRQGAPTVGFADFNGDGVPEVYIGNRLFNAATGAFLCDGGSHNKGFSIQDSTVYGGLFPVAVDVDGNGRPELIAGNEVYRVTETGGVWAMQVYKSIAPPVLSNGVQVISDGHVSIADLNDDGRPDALISVIQQTSGAYYAVLYGWDITHNRLLFREHFATAKKNIPALGDIDGDGAPEILVQFNSRLRAYKLPSSMGASSGLSLFWEYPLDGAGHSGVTLFDFNQDSIAEIVCRDRSQLRILDGRQTPPVVLDSRASTSDAQWAMPVVADVDGDRLAEIVVASGTSFGDTHLYVYDPDVSAGASWAPARRVWNQYAYNAVNVHEDLTVPSKLFNPAIRYPGGNNQSGDADDLRPYNAFLQQQTLIDRRGAPVWPAPDGTIVGTPQFEYHAGGDTMRIRLTIANTGAAGFHPPLYIAVYKDRVEAARTIAVDSILSPVNAGDTVEVSIVLPGFSGLLLPDSLIIRLNDRGQAAYVQGECHYGGNTAVRRLSGLLLAHNDLAQTDVRHPVNIAVLRNDSVPAGCRAPGLPAFGVISGPGLHFGSLAVNADSTLTYTPAGGVAGVDSVDYYIRCADDSSVARVYIALHRPLAGTYFACPGASLTTGFAPVAGLQYHWYDAPVAGHLEDVAAQRTVQKDSSALQTWWVEPVYGAQVFPRIRVEAAIAGLCGKTHSYGDCAATEEFPFKEDFGGNTLESPPVKVEGLTPAPDYQYTTSLPAPGQYTIVKSTGSLNGAGWYGNMSDHSWPGNKDRGYMAVFNAGSGAARVYRYEAAGLCAGMKLTLSAWIANVFTTVRPHQAALLFVVEDLSGHELAHYYTGAIPQTDSLWKQYGFEFVVPAGQTGLLLKLINHSNGDDGSAFAIDDLELRFCAPEVMVDREFEHLCSDSVLLLSGNYTADPIFGHDLLAQWEYTSAAGTNTARVWTPVGSPAVSDNGYISHSYREEHSRPAHSGYYRLAVYHTGHIGGDPCRAISKAIRVQVDTTPGRPVIQAPSGVCVGETLQFDVPALYAGYEWRMHDSTGPVSGTAPFLTVQTPGIHTYVVRVHNERGCRSPYSAPASGTVFAATATATGITVSGLSSDYAATPPTVRFSVSWRDNSRDCRHRQAVWLLVDYSPLSGGQPGPWTRARLAGTPVIETATAAGGTIATEAGNTEGFWLHGLEGAYSATITAPVNVVPAAIFSWCAYASDYPPNAVATGAVYRLHGTPPFIVNGVSQGSARTFSGCINALSDATGCPGLLPPAPRILSLAASPSTITAGAAATLLVTATGATEYSFDGGRSWSPAGYLVVSPATTTQYHIHVKAPGGCVVTDVLTLTVTP